MKTIILVILALTLTLISVGQIKLNEQYKGKSKHFFYIHNTSFRKVLDNVELIKGIKADLVFINIDTNRNVQKVEYYFKDMQHKDNIIEYYNKKYKSSVWANDTIKASIDCTDMNEYPLRLVEQRVNLDR